MRKRPLYILSSLRKEAGLTQKQLAALLHISVRALSRWESGAQTLPVRRVAGICRLLGQEAQIPALLRQLHVPTPTAPAAPDESPDTCPDLWAEAHGYPGWPAEPPYRMQQGWLRANWLRLKATFDLPTALLVEQVLCVGAQGKVPPEFADYQSAMYSCALALEDGHDPGGALAIGAAQDLC